MTLPASCSWIFSSSIGVVMMIWNIVICGSRHGQVRTFYHLGGYAVSRIFYPIYIYCKSSPDPEQQINFLPLGPTPGLWIETVNWRLCGSGSKKIGSFFIVFQEQNLKVFFVLGRTYHLLSSVGTRTGTELYRVPMHWRLPVYKKRSGLTWQSPAAPPAAISLVTGRLPSFRVNLGQKKNS